MLIPFHLFVQATGSHAIDRSQVSVENDSNTTNFDNAFLDTNRRHQCCLFRHGQFFTTMQ